MDSALIASGGGSRPGHFTDPADSPPCQKRWMKRKAMITGTMETSEPAITTVIEQRPAAAAGGRGVPVGEAHRDGEVLGRVEHDERQEVIVPGGDERQHEHVETAGVDQPEGDHEKIRNSPAPSTATGIDLISLLTASSI